MANKMSKLEERALKLLIRFEGRGLLQSELWHKLRVTSREGSRIAIKLEKKGVVKRVKEFANDRWTRRLVPLINRIEVESIHGSPCPSCIYNSICRPGGAVTPNTCVWIEDWLISGLRQIQSSSIVSQRVT